MWGFYPLPAGIGGIVIILMILAFPQVGMGLLLAGVCILLINNGMGFWGSLIAVALLFIAVVGIFCVMTESAEEEKKDEYREKIRALKTEFSDIQDFDYLAESDKAIKEGPSEALENLDKRAGRYAEWKKRAEALRAELHS